jgi:hypothetical protein
MSCSSNDDGGDVTTPRDINTLNQAMTTDESVFSNAEVRLIVGGCIRTMLYNKYKLTKDNKLTAKRTIRKIFKATKFVTDATMAQFGLVEFVLNELDIHHPNKRASMYPSLLSYIKSEIAEKRSDVVKRIIILLKGRLF